MLGGGGERGDCRGGEGSDRKGVNSWTRRVGRWD